MVKILVVSFLLSTASAAQTATPSEPVTTEQVCSYTVTPAGCQMCCKTPRLEVCRNLRQNNCPKKKVKEFNGEDRLNE